jgi:hypothetical protein
MHDREGLTAGRVESSVGIEMFSGVPAMQTPTTIGGKKDLRNSLEQEADALARELDGVVDPATVKRCVFETFDRFYANARLTDYVPLFVHRRAREQLLTGNP